MKYSFIKPRQKYLLEGDTKFWILFIITSTAILLAFGFFLKYKTSNLTNLTQMAIVKQKKSQKSIESLNDKMAFVNRQKAVANKIYSSNLVLKEAIENIFGLVPDEITLTKVEMKKKELILYGLSPSKEIYNFLLLAPLKSIFTKNDTTFYMLENGWFRFVSVNRIEDYVGVVE